MASSITETVALEPTYHMKLQSNATSSAAKAPNNTLRLKQLKLDPTRALEPARKKLSSIEAQRIMAVFEDTIKKSEIVTSLPHIIENIDRFKVSLGSELADAIKQHNGIQITYRDVRAQLDDLLQRREKLMALAAERAEQERLAMENDVEEEIENLDENDNRIEPDDDIKSQKGVADNVEKMVASEMAEAADLDPRIEEVMRSLGLVAQQVSHSCKNILRLFSLNPAAARVVTNDMSIRDEGGQKIVQSLNDLRDILMHKLLTTPTEECEKMNYVEEISKRERHNAAIIERQETELRAALDDKEEEIRKKNDVIKRLQTDLHQIEKFSDENIRRTRAEAEKQEIADSKNSDQKTQKLQTEINQLQSQLNTAISENRDQEADLRSKKFKVENEVDNWIQKYDQDMGERQDEYEEIDIVYTEEKKQLLELEERFATLEKEYLAIMEERRVARDKRERAQRELALLVKAATTIQAFWRSYKVRKALKAKSKKKGKKSKS